MHSILGTKRHALYMPDPLLPFSGLFTADQNLNGDTSIYTRQNAAGTRRGFECSEERDYYPYWHPSEWKDIAVLPSETSRCAYYEKESFNVKPKCRWCTLEMSALEGDRLWLWWCDSRLLWGLRSVELNHQIVPAGFFCGRGEIGMT